MNRTSKRFLHRTERAIHRLLVPAWRRHREVEEEVLGRVLKELNVDCVFDVGANRGDYGLTLRDYCGFKGQIISFEPVPDVFKTLSAVSSADALWDVHNHALGRREETLSLQVHQARMGSSFLQMADGDSGTAGNQIVQSIDVPVRPLNEIFAAFQNRFGFRRPFLKMDTQGFDVQVFLGAGKVIDAFVGLQSELSIDPFYKGAPEWQDSLKTYQEAGFILTAFIPSNPDTSLVLREVDCIMVRGKEAAAH